MVQLADSTVETVTENLTLTQFRALRTITSRTPVTMGRVAEALRMNPSSVTRACERLVGQKLVHRAQNPLNKREILLAPTARGRQVVERVDADRRAVLTAALRQLPPDDRAVVVAALRTFTAALVAVPTNSASGTDR